jgi:Bacterial regulatory helix-turn-helix protein, lysR family
MKDIFALRLYTRVARLGGFSAAARECELSQSQASRIIADLESDLRCEPAIVPSQLLELLVRFLGNVARLSMRAGLSSANVSMLSSGAATRSKRNGLACTVDAR